ncbi:MAG: HAMP domain-containing sensor histidine kinase [Caulobacteraceae bacterium]|nr:HAMP domain-containing sensor histidine kinase [Caulobacteraceae bacterium]
MPEAGLIRSRQSTLFAQIATRLVLVAFAFAVLDIAIVIADYARDPQAMAEDFVTQQANRIEHSWRAATRPGGGPSLAQLAAPAGVSDWTYVIIDRSRRPVVQAGDPSLIDASGWPTPSTLDWTRRDRVASGVQITGLRRFDGSLDQHWVLVAAETQGGVVYWPVIAGELVDHVAVPLAPLTALLLIFNIIVVRRMLGPLSVAAAEADKLDPSRMDGRLTEPTASREVAALVVAVNRALDRLQRAMTQLKDFTADAAHELRTPLSVMRLRVEALPEGPAKQSLGDDVQAMTRLVNQMLDLSQADALTMDQAQDVDLHALATDVIAQMAPLAFELDQDIRLSDRGATQIRGHSDALGRALRNLLENAIVHGRGTGPIEVEAGPGPRISVRDHGQGLGALEPDAIFRRFWRKRRDRGGAGLGLGIARSIVEAHGGTITARNMPDGGALFVCEFPSHAAIPNRRAPSATAANPNLD